MSEVAGGLFQDERTLLERALREAGKIDHQENALLPAYRELVQGYRKLLRQSEKMLRIGDKNQSFVKTIQNNLECLLDNAGQGFLTFGPELTVDSEYSLECVRIFGGDIAGKNCVPLLFGSPEVGVEQDVFSGVFEDILRCVFNEREDKEDVYLSLLPEEIVVEHLLLSARYTYISKENKILCILTDISEKRDLQQEVERERQSLKTALSAVVNYSAIKRTLHEIKDYLNYEIYEKLHAVHPRLFAEDVYKKLHTYKGIFGYWNMKSTAEQLHALESDLESLLANAEEISEEKLLRFFAGIDVYSILEKDMATIESILGKSYLKQEETLPTPSRLLESLRCGVREYFPAGEERDGLVFEIGKLMSLSLKQTLSTFREHVIELASEKLKKIDSFLIAGEDVLLDEKRCGDFCKSLLHLFRNVVYHGIENPEDRVAQGKSSGGNIRCELMKDEDSIRLVITDDGRGIDVEALKRKAEEGKVYSRSEIDALSREQALQLVFAERVSTALTACEMAGRGVGLVALREEVLKLGGEIGVESESGLFTSFTLSLPEQSLRQDDTEADIRRRKRERGECYWHE